MFLRNLVELLHESSRTVVDALFRADNVGHGVSIVDKLTSSSVRLLIQVGEKIGVPGKGRPERWIKVSLCETRRDRVDGFDSGRISNSDLIWCNADDRTLDSQ